MKPTTITLLALCVITTYAAVSMAQAPAAKLLPEFQPGGQKGIDTFDPTQDDPTNLQGRVNCPTGSCDDTMKQMPDYSLKEPYTVFVNGAPNAKLPMDTTKAKK